MNIVVKENNNPKIKTDAAATTHIGTLPSASIMINRVGVYYANKYSKQPQDLLSKCAYFRVHCRMPEQKIEGDTFTSMKKNAEQFYNGLPLLERNKLQTYYEGLPQEWRD